MLTVNTLGSIWITGCATPTYPVVSNICLSTAFFVAGKYGAETNLVCAVVIGRGHAQAAIVTERPATVDNVVPLVWDGVYIKPGSWRSGFEPILVLN